MAGPFSQQIHRTPSVVLRTQTATLTSRTVSYEIADVRKRKYRGADKYLARPGMKQATATEDFDVHISYLLS